MQFEYAYIFGAVCPELDLNAALILPEIGIDAMNIHLEEISQIIPRGRHAVIVFDRASWHTSGKLKKFQNISLFPLPAAAPELNPQEQVWQWLRDNDLANRCYSGYEDILESCCKAWNNFTSIKGRIKNLCSRKWAKIL